MAIDQGHGNQRDEDVGHPDDCRGQYGSLRRGITRHLQDGGRIIDDRIDAGNLLKDGETYSY